MENIELVKYPGNVNDPFDPNLIDKIKIKSFFDDSYEKCEHWGWNEDGENEHPYFDYGKLGGFIDFDVYDYSVKLYFGFGMDIGYPRRDERNIKMFNHSEFDFDKHCLKLDFFPEKLYSRYPETIAEFIEMVIDFIQFVLEEFDLIKTKHLLKIKKMKRRSVLRPLLPKKPDDTDLPF